MHVIAYEHLVGFPRESKQHLDAVRMCGRLQRGARGLADGEIPPRA